MPLLAITANDIDSAGLEVDAELPVTWLDSELADADVNAVASGHVTARLSRSGKCVVVRGRVTAEVTAHCARCLDPTRIALDGELSLLLSPIASHKPVKPARTHAKGAHGALPPAGAPSAERAASAKERRPAPRDPEYEFTTEEAETDTFDGETVVLDGFLREALLLELPNFPLCSEACAGIRPPAAAPSGNALAEAKKPLDPRLAPLGALRAKLFEPRGAEEASNPRRAASAATQATTRRARSTPLKANLTKTKKKSKKE